MTAFSACLAVEQKSKRLLLPFVLERFGHAPEEVPHTYDAQTQGDWIVTRQDGYRFYVELKAEAETTGNLFLETVSNWHTTRYGWLLTSHADWLWYHFLDTNWLYLIPMGALREWFWGDQDDVDAGACERYREVSQQKHEQGNLTKGFLVPANDVMREVRGTELVRLNGVVHGRI